MDRCVGVNCTVNVGVKTDFAFLLQKGLKIEFFISNPKQPKAITKWLWKLQINSKSVICLWFIKLIKIIFYKLSQKIEIIMLTKWRKCAITNLVNYAIHMKYRFLFNKRQNLDLTITHSLLVSNCVYKDSNFSLFFLFFY